MVDGLGGCILRAMLSRSLAWQVISVLVSFNLPHRSVETRGSLGLGGLRFASAAWRPQQFYGVNNYKLEYRAYFLSPKTGFHNFSFLELGGPS